MNVFKLSLQFAKEISEYIKKGAPNVTLDQYEERIKICSKCPHKKEGTHFSTCGVCGCNLEIKAKWATSTCPDKPKRWPELKKK